MRLPLLALALAALLTSAGCLELLCEGPVIETRSAWQGSRIEAPVISTAAGVTLTAWTRDGLQVAVNEGGIVHSRFSLQGLAAVQLVSAPTGHLVLSAGRGPVSALSLDLRAALPPAPISLAAASICGTAATFDGQRFLIAWCEGGAMKLASLVPGTSAPSVPLVIGAATERSIAMASSGGVTWIVWRLGAVVVGVRHASGAVIDATPRVLVDDPRIDNLTSIAIAASGGRFLIAVDAHRGTPKAGSLLVPFGGDAVVGAIIELPGSAHLQLVGEELGFAALERPVGQIPFGQSTQLPVTRLALDGEQIEQRSLAAGDAMLASDGARLLAAVRIESIDPTDKDRGTSVLSFGELRAPRVVEVAASSLHSTVTEMCTAPPGEGF